LDDGFVFRRRDEIRERLREVVKKFREKGAVSQEKAMTPEELGLPSKFQTTMKRRLGQLGVFVEVNGKYYLSEERLKEVKERFASRKR
jgi:lipoate-protein ligase A